MSATHYLTYVCMTCGLAYGIKPTLSHRDGISHGYCLTCGPRELAKVRRQFSTADNLKPASSAAPQPAGLMTLEAQPSAVESFSK